MGRERHQWYVFGFAFLASDNNFLGLFSFMTWLSLVCLQERPRSSQWSLTPSSSSIVCLLPTSSWVTRSWMPPISWFRHSSTSTPRSPKRKLSENTAGLKQLLSQRWEETLRAVSHYVVPDIYAN